MPAANSDMTLKAIKDQALKTALTAKTGLANHDVLSGLHGADGALDANGNARLLTLTEYYRPRTSAQIQSYSGPPSTVPTVSYLRPISGATRLRTASWRPI